MVMLQTTVPAYKTLGADCADEVGKWRASFLSFFFLGRCFAPAHCSKIMPKMKGLPAWFKLLAIFFYWSHVGLHNRAHYLVVCSMNASCIAHIPLQETVLSRSSVVVRCNLFILPFLSRFMCAVCL